MSSEALTATHPGRRRAVLGLVALVALLLLVRGLDLTFTRKEFLQDQGDARILRVVQMPAMRGMILDRNGEPLAASTPVHSVWVNPVELADRPEDLQALARLLGLSRAQMEAVVDPGERSRPRRFAYLRRHVEPHLAARVTTLVETRKIPGVGLQQEFRRYYPAGEVASHVVGFTNVDEVGQEGIERAYEHWLQGQDGSKLVMRDRLGRVVEDVESIRAARPGQDLYLSLDRRIQYVAYRELKAAVHRHGAKGGSLVILDTLTGEVVAMVNQPSFNPNNNAERTGPQIRNRAVTDLIEPGSTMKSFTVAAGLDAGLFTPETIIQTAPGTLRVGRYTVRDINNYGAIDLGTLIQKSSNVGSTKIALAISAEKLWRTLAGVGFGTPTGSGFPGEVSGTLTSYTRWGEIHRATLSFGYGLSSTPLQLARAYLALARDGSLLPVSLLRVDKPVEATRVLSPTVVRQVRAMMERVTEQGGSGQSARVPGYKVAGKTGTVKKTAGGRYASNRYMAMFAGMAPATNPRLVGVVVIDEPSGKAYYGGQVAAPVFGRVMAESLRILGVAPDDRHGVGQWVALGARPAAVPAATDL